jgi:dihydroflavonol-4-reductase
MTNTNGKQEVLVTGGSGFIGAHCILRLLSQGFRVRTTVRSLSREHEVRAMLEEGGSVPGNLLSFVEADLSSDAGWNEAVSGCAYVLHVASPTPLKEYKNDDEMIVPAREGVLRVLRTARDAGVQRVVLTSAFSAIGMGHQPQTKPYNETHWTELNDNVPVYQKSKTLAERAAWDFIKKEGGKLELAVVNPVAVLGPVLGPDYSHSINLIQRLMDGEMPGCPKINSCFVDVRDVADLHVLAMTNPAAKGERFLATAGESIWVVDIAKLLKNKMGPLAMKVPTKELPNWLLKIVALRDPAVKVLVPMLGVRMNATSEKARRILGWEPRSTEEAILATAESLARLGLLKK